MLPWGKLKHEVCKNDAYLDQPWYKDLSRDDQALIQEYRAASLEAKAMMNKSFLPPISASMKKQIEDRIEGLFSNENFYFGKEDDGQDPEIYVNEFDRIIDDCMASKGFYISKGMLVPTHQPWRGRKLVEVKGLQLTNPYSGLESVRSLGNNLAE